MRAGWSHSSRVEPTLAPVETPGSLCRNPGPFERCTAGLIEPVSHLLERALGMAADPGRAVPMGLTSGMTQRLGRCSPEGRRGRVLPGLRPDIGVARSERDFRGAAYRDPFRVARRFEDAIAMGGADRPRCRDGGRDQRVRHASRPDGACGLRGCRFRALPDHVDCSHGDLGLQHDGRVGAFRRPPALSRDGLQRPTDPGRDDRLLLRCAVRGARGLRRPGSDHVDDDGRPRVRADQSRLACPRGEYRAGPVRCDRHPDHDAV